MKILIGNHSRRALTVKSTGRGTRTLDPTGVSARVFNESVPFDAGLNELLFVNAVKETEDDESTITVKVGNAGDRDVIAEVQGGFIRALSPLSFGEKIARRHVTLTFKASQTLVLRTRGARDAEGIEIRTPV